MRVKKKSRDELQNKRKTSTTAAAAGAATTRERTQAASNLQGDATLDIFPAMDSGTDALNYMLEEKNNNLG